MARYTSVFSNYEIKNASIKIENAEAFAKLGCVGSLEEELEVKVVTKNCEGVLAKSVARGSGAGTLSLSLHMKYDLYIDIFGMDIEGLAEGVYAYGKNSRHREFCFVAEVFDEDGNKKLVAYPKCRINSAPDCSITNGAEEVAEIEIGINLYPDEEGNCKYEAVVAELAADNNIADQWMTAFTPDLVKGE